MLRELRRGVQSFSFDFYFLFSPYPHQQFYSSNTQPLLLLSVIDTVSKPHEFWSLPTLLTQHPP